MKDCLARDGLVYTHGILSDDFFDLVDRTGGWPVGYQYVGIEHTKQRAAIFTNNRTNTEWWSLLYTADDYYMWKLSPEAIERIAASAIAKVAESLAEIKLKADKLGIRDSRGYIAALNPRPLAVRCRDV